MNNTSPHERRILRDATGRPVGSNGNAVTIQKDIVTDMLWPVFFSQLAAVRIARPGERSEDVANLALSDAKAALARIGFSINETHTPDPAEQPPQ
jgi:hypothetical protein